MPHSPPRATLLLVSMTLAFLASCATQKSEQTLFDGYLCCNMQSDGSWISDINYRAGAKQFVPAGAPVKVTGYGRWRVQLEVGGKKLALGNDFSRSINLGAFARRYVIDNDPSRRLAGYAAPVRDAIKDAKVARDMTREQVVMALGYPVTTYTTDLDAPLWRYWLTAADEFQVFWGADGKVERVFGTPHARAQVAIE